MCERRDRSIEELIEASSLGTPAAKAARASVPPEVAAKVVRRARQIAERDEIARVLDDWPSRFAAADALIAANVRHLPSLPDDEEVVERVARKMCLGFTNDTKREAMAGYRIMARDLLRALAGGE